MTIVAVTDRWILWRKNGDAPYTVRKEPKGTRLWLKLLYKAISLGLA